MEQDSLSKLLNGVLLKKYSCINDIVVLYNEITPNAYVVTVYVIPVSSSKGFEDCNRDYPKIKNDIINEKQTMKQLLKEEFGLFKKDTTVVKPQKDPKKQNKVIISFDEDEE